MIGCCDVVILLYFVLFISVNIIRTQQYRTFAFTRIIYVFFIFLRRIHFSSSFSSSLVTCYLLPQASWSTFGAPLQTSILNTLLWRLPGMNCRETIISVWALGKLGVSYRHLAGGVASPFTKAVVATAASAAGSAGGAARREAKVDKYGIRSVSFH